MKDNEFLNDYYLTGLVRWTNWRVENMQKVFTAYRADIVVFFHREALCLSFSQFKAYPRDQNDSHLQLTAKNLAKESF